MFGLRLLVILYRLFSGTLPQQSKVCFLLSHTAIMKKYGTKLPGILV